MWAPTPISSYRSDGPRHSLARGRSGRLMPKSSSSHWLRLAIHHSQLSRHTLVGLAHQSDQQKGLGLLQYDQQIWFKQQASSKTGFQQVSHPLEDLSILEVIYPPFILLHQRNSLSQTISDIQYGQSLLGKVRYSTPDTYPA